MHKRLENWVEKMNIDPEKDKQRLKRMFNHPTIRKFMLKNLICFGVLLLLWVYINGGLLPFFVKQKIPSLRLGSESNVLQYFSAAQNDGANVRWAHGVNTLDLLERALYSNDIHMIEADVMIRGQGTAEQQLIPVMAQLPDTDSKVTFDEWLDHVIKASSKGIKLDFQAIDALEITLQKLKNRKSEITVPVWLHANVLQGPLGDHPKVDGTRFIRIVKKMFPECTLSLGWTTGKHTDMSLAAYTWDMVLEMYHLVYKMEVDIPLVITARATFLVNSVPQLKWLADNTKSSLLVWQSLADKEDGFHEHVMYVCYRFPPNLAYFDLSDSTLETYLVENRAYSKDKVDPRVLTRDTKMFRPDGWIKMGFFMEPHSILPSTEAVVLTSRAVYMVTKTKHKPSETLELHGRVQFLNQKNLSPEQHRTGLSIFLRSTSYVDYDRMVGIKCFLGVDGEMVIENSHLRAKDFHESQTLTPGSQGCYRFSVVDTGSQVKFRVSVQHDCMSLESAKANSRLTSEVTLNIPADVGGTNVEHPFIVKLEDSKRTAILDELTLKEAI